ncbi:hypothetical protein CGRA01v4_12911 [Colletotrichum graminicola]|nr:hypothetical protein CGRA01v4_12911 [Colletotrichum graminicola]
MVACVLFPNPVATPHQTALPLAPVSSQTVRLPETRRRLTHDCPHRVLLANQRATRDGLGAISFRTSRRISACLPMLTASLLPTSLLQKLHVI